MTYSGALYTGRLELERWRTEPVLHALVVVLSLLIWLLLAITVVGLVYAVFLGVFFFVMHTVFVAYIRGSGVKLGLEQFPDLHGAVVRLSQDMGMEPPDAYIMQSGGALNALATRFLGGNMIVLYSDLLEACDENQSARDMIVAHELAHLKCGHLQWRWLMLPGLMIPFLGGALSRAREYTCDRYGYAAGGSSEDALRGLAILAAGPKYGQDMNLNRFVEQREDVNTGLMTLAEWLASHPPLSKRVAVLDGAYGDPLFSSVKGNVRALAITGTVGFVVVGGIAALALGFREFAASLDTPGGSQPTQNVSVEEMADIVARDFQLLSTFIAEEWWSTTHTVPRGFYEVAERWEQLKPNEDLPFDPHDGYAYGYELEGAGYRMWSSGPDGQSGTADDIIYNWTPPQ